MNHKARRRNHKGTKLLCVFVVQWFIRLIRYITAPVPATTNTTVSATLSQRGMR